MKEEKFRGVNTDDWTPDDLERVFDRVRCNPVMFTELFWNVAYPDKKVELTDEQKQKFFNKYKRIPLIGPGQLIHKYEEKCDEMRAKGYKDWEFMDL